VRHGETEENRKGIIQGTLDTVLNETGIKQSRILGETLKEVEITHVFCSPLKRAMQTYDEIAPFHSLECVYTPDIREYHCGRLQGWTRQQGQIIAQSEGMSYDKFRSLGAETYESIFGRLDSFWKREILPLKETDAIVLVVSHGGIIGGLRKHLLGKNYTIHDSLRCEVSGRRKWEVYNCSITEITLDEEGHGEFITIGYFDHILNAERKPYDEQRLENSTGE